jgi:heme-degrading monooxygenase HmoA
MFIVMVRFQVLGTFEEIEPSIQRLLATIVRRQPGFQSARIHRRDDGAEVVNYMIWNDRASFDAFRTRHKDEVWHDVGRFGPQSSIYDVVHEARSEASG